MSLDRPDNTWRQGVDGRWYPPPAPDPPPRPRKDSGTRAMQWLILIGMVTVLGLYIYSVANDMSSGRSDFYATARPLMVENPSALVVQVTVANIGKESGSPTCTVGASDSSGTYSGGGVFDTTYIEPGDDYTFRATLAIDQAGAGFVTSASAECE